jgi:cyclopropane fatty-acyl-phospholipid synthase-like methyltransferase
MASLVDDRGYNQGYRWTPTTEVRMRRRADAILEAAGVHDGDRLLEVGCGTGELAHFLARDSRAHVTGVDLCEPFIAQAKAAFGNERLDFVAADLSKADDVQRLGQRFNAVVGNGILHHLYFHIDDAVQRLAQLLVPGGRFVFWEPNLFNPYVYAIFSFKPLRKLAKLEPDEMAFTPRWIEKHLFAAGFRDVRAEFRDFLVPVVPYRLVPMVMKPGDVAERLPGVNRLAQSLFITATRA